MSKRLCEWVKRRRVWEWMTQAVIYAICNGLTITQVNNKDDLWSVGAKAIKDNM